MKKFNLKFIIFLIPFILLLLNYLTYEKSGGDLNRLGKVSVKKDYRNKFNKEFNQKKFFEDFSKLDLNEKNNFDVFTIGDSFSQQENYGYQNYISKDHNLSIVNFDSKYFYGDNPFQMLIEFTNGDLFKNLKVKYIVLESVERYFLFRGSNSDLNRKINKKDFNLKYRKNIINVMKSEKKIEFTIFNEIIKYNIYSLLYNFNSRAFISSIYKLKLNKVLFSIKKNNLLIFHQDVSNIKFTNQNNIKITNEKLNFLSEKLKEKGICLIVLPCADKLTLYHDYLIKDNFPKNNFFEMNEKVYKDYKYIDSKKILEKPIKEGVKDVYFADDTHWSPIASKIIAEEIFRVIENNNF